MRRAVLAALVLIVAAVVAYTVLHTLSRTTKPASTAVKNTTASRAEGPASRKPGTQTGQNVGAKNSTLVIALGDWGPPSPYLFYPRGPGYVVTSFAFDTLVWKNQTGVVPWLAASWEHPNATTWVFHLRRNLYWQDGVPLTARDVVFTFKYMMRHGWTWKNISPKLVETIYAPDNYTVVIVLRKPYAFFLEDYASTVFILPEHIWRNVGNPYTFRSKEAFIGSGPYILKEYKPQEEYVFIANKRFWLGKPIYTKLVVLAEGLGSPQQVAAAIKAGKVDSAAFMGKAYRIVKMLEREIPGLRVEKGPMYFVVFLGFNLDKWPYNTTLFRRAVAYALNLTEVVYRAAGGPKAAIPGTPGYVPPYSKFYNPHVPRYPYDPGKAKQLLAKLGLKDVNGDGCLELPGGREWKPLLVAPKWYSQEAYLVAEMLRRVGICVRVKTVESIKLLDSIVRSGRYDLEINGHGADGNTPTSFTWFFSGRFGAKWSNETYWRIVSKIMSAETKEEAYRYAEEAQLIIAEQLPRIALYYPNIFVVTRPGVKVHWFFTDGGIDGGIPLPYNKLALIKEG